MKKRDWIVGGWGASIEFENGTRVDMRIDYQGHVNEISDQLKAIEHGLAELPENR